METQLVNPALSMTGKTHNSYIFRGFSASLNIMVNIDFSNNIGKSMMANNGNTKTKVDFSIDSFCDVFVVF